MKKIILGILFLLSPTLSEAKVIHLGVAIGGNYSSGSAITGIFPFAASTNLSGWGLSGAVSLSFFQDNWIGLRISEDYVGTSISGAAFSLNATSLISSAQVAFNFNLFGNRHSLGLGGTWHSNVSRSANLGLATMSSSSYGFIIEGKDMWEVNQTQAIFVCAKVFGTLNNATLSLVNISFLIGYDF